MALAFKIVPGVRLGVAAAGIKYADRNDLLVIELPAGASCAGVFHAKCLQCRPGATGAQAPGEREPPAICW